ncbi:TLC domain-containing protein 5-like [Nymphalis io]|uniref:TLC domain-containing protein 5-like n=1 Tax=Inachis io TaxID=171585 RepID=UPI0021684AD1|nr:TLC domain-containing protein 5-like [Nymphalis io]
MALQHELSTPSLLKLLSFIFWGWTYIWCTEKAPDHRPEWHSRVVTLLHGSVATIVGLWQCGMTNIDRCRLNTKITPANYALMLWSWGYFAFDLIWCIIYWSNSYVILGHHISALIAVGIYMNKTYSGCTFACTLALMEITNPILQTRWLLRDSGYGHTKLYFLVELTYLIMFLSLRGPLCTYLIYKILPSDYLDIDEKLISLALYAVSIVFIYEILGYVIHKYKNKIKEFKGFANEIIVALVEN